MRKGGEGGGSTVVFSSQFISRLAGLFTVEALQEWRKEVSIDVKGDVGLLRRM